MIYLLRAELAENEETYVVAYNLMGKGKELDEAIREKDSTDSLIKINKVLKEAFGLSDQDIVYYVRVGDDSNFLQDMMNVVPEVENETGYMITKIHMEEVA